MPYITVEGGVLWDKQKEQLIKRLTEVSSEIMKVPSENFMTIIKELPEKDFGIGVKTIEIMKDENIKKYQHILISE